MGNHPGKLNPSGSSRTVDQGPDRWTKSPLQGERHLGATRAFTDGRSGSRARSIGAHSIRRTNATLIYRRTKNLRAVQLLLGHAKLNSTVRYLGIEVDDALEIYEQTEI
jgi:site-specific recombinase XerC